MFWMGQYVHVLNLQRELIEPVCTLGNVVKELYIHSVLVKDYHCTLTFAYILLQIKYISVMSGTT